MSDQHKEIMAHLKASGKFLIYLDADMILTNQLIEQCVFQCECQNIDALYIPEKIVGKGFWIKVRDFERELYSGTVIDAVRFIRRDLFLKAGGFDESRGGFRRLGFRQENQEFRSDRAIKGIFIPQ